MTVLDFIGCKKEGRRMSMVTCYDYTFARILNQSPVDILLVGDSCGMTMHGFKSTIPVTVEMMAYHTAAVARGAPDKFIVADLPFLSFRKSLTENMNAVEKLMQAGGQAVKLEGLQGNEEFIRHCVGSGVPVVAHLGLTPQFIHLMGGFKVQGRSDDAKKQILDDALAVQDCGASCLVLECVPAALAKELTKKLTIPTIGIGAGLDCDGQVLVLQDLLGMNSDFKPRFVRNYLNGEEIIRTALTQYHNEVLERRFPSEKESFS
jgi:3-methyl-2-oxobutanoate hydroxymethyltransferase